MHSIILHSSVYRHSDVLKIDIQGNKFIKFGIGLRDDRILVFYAEFKKEFILKCDAVLVDGTFKVAARDYT
ncbi:hypothetical protein ENBRE01_2097 [Enteropsectra breve]|nr:hypothetical protein ENBRE01_2097 [Enteropsectra breve]